MSAHRSRIAVFAEHEAARERTAALSQRLSLPLAGNEDAENIDYLLRVGIHGLSLEATGTRQKPVRVDFTGGALGWRLRSGGAERLLASAVGLRRGYRPAVLDATAGFGEDAFVLASLGCSVTLLERQPVIAALLADGLERARANGGKAAKVAERVSLIVCDAREYLAAQATAPEVVCLDPMFPPRQKTALSKKSARFLHDLAGPDADADTLLAAALERASRRVVVKRPRHALPLGERLPDYRLEGRAVRFDVHIVT